MTPFSLLYDAAQHVYVLLSLPKVLLSLKKYRGTLLKRFGKNFPEVQKRGRPLIWVHAVSVGETLAVAPLVKRLKALPSAPLVLLSTITKTGHEIGLKSIPEADHHVYLPLDLPYIIHPILKRVQPDLLLLSETDFWFHLQEGAKKMGAKIALVNGKLSERSFNRLRKLSSLKKHLFSPFDHFYLQGEAYQERFQALGISSSKLTVTGNLKLDAPLEEHDTSLLASRLKLDEFPVLTIGSTHAPEEEIWLKALLELWKSFPDLKVFLVPRHPERFDEVARLIESLKIPYSRWSAGGTFAESNLVLVDAMGELKKCYALSTLAFVGGTFAPKVGGHNIVEPAYFGVPVLFGPHMHSQPDFLELVTRFKAGVQLEENDIVSVTKHLFSSPKQIHDLGENGRCLVAASKGALYKTLSGVLSLLEK